MLPVEFVNWLFRKLFGGISLAPAGVPVGCLAQILLVPVFIVAGVFGVLFYTFRDSYYVLVHDPPWRWVLIAAMGLGALQTLYSGAGLSGLFIWAVLVALIGWTRAQWVSYLRQKEARVR